MLESKVEAYLVRRVESYGGDCCKVKWIGRRGAPDRLVRLFRGAPKVMPGAYWVELKRPGVKAEDHQLREHDRLRSCGMEVLVLDSIESIDEWLGR